MHLVNIKFFRLITLILFLVLLQQCCSSGENIQDDVKIKMSTLNKIPYGAADLTFKFLEIRETNNIHGLVEKIHGYGSQMRPLAEGNIYDFDFPERLFNIIKDNLGKSKKIRITSTPHLFGGSQKGNYKILSIENSKNNNE
jgi:hypothetical protein